MINSFAKITFCISLTVISYCISKLLNISEFSTGMITILGYFTGLNLYEVFE